MESSITLVSWNVFQGLDHSSKKPNWIRNDAVEAHLQAFDADVLVLPELWRFGHPGATWAEDIADQLGYELHQWVADRPSRTRELVPWRMAVLTRVPARRLDDVVLPPPTRFAQRAGVRVELVDSGLTVLGVHLYGIHLLLQHGPRAWFRERAALRAAAGDVDIVAGDFNIWGPVARRDTPGKRSAVTGRTFPARRPHSQIDHVLVSDRVEIVSGEVLPDLGSDHRPIKTVLRPS